MARPGLTKHRKFRRLARLLGSEALALGHLEWLWSVCYEDGNDYLGDSDDVESAAKWTGTPGELTQALLACGGDGHAGFIDEVSPGHYQAHDLFDHAPDYVRRRSRRERQRVTRDQLVTGQRPVADPPVTLTPAPAPAPAPSPKSVTRVREAPASAGADTRTPASARGIWDSYRDAGAAAGRQLPLEPSPKDFEHLRVLSASYTLDELRPALFVWWASPHVERRYLGTFRADVADVLAHVASGTTTAFRAPVAKPSPYAIGAGATELIARMAARGAPKD